MAANVASERVITIWAVHSKEAYTAQKGLTRVNLTFPLHGALATEAEMVDTGT